jgi:hypothetical protein
MTSPIVRKFVSPLDGSFPTSSGYGQRDGQLHAGVDYAAPAGTGVNAVYPGKVVEAGFNSGGWGNTVLIDHGVVNGEHLYTRYAHLLSDPSVDVGDTVTAGQAIGKVGSTGDSSGNHLHFGAYQGNEAVNATSVDPTAILKGATGTTPLDALGGLLGAPGEAISGALGALLERIGKAADAYTSKAKIAEQIATSVTKIFLPSSLLRGAAGGLGIILLCFALYFLGRELRA